MLLKPEATHESELEMIRPVIRENTTYSGALAVRSCGNIIKLTLDQK